MVAKELTLSRQYAMTGGYFYNTITSIIVDRYANTIENACVAHRAFGKLFHNQVYCSPFKSIVWIE